MNSFVSTLRKTFQYAGRSGRREFWIFFGVSVSLAICGIGADFALGWFDMEYGLGPISGVLCILFALPSIAVAVRRFHDTDKTGWLYLVNFVPVVGPFLLLIFMAQKGTEGENRFGSDPRAANGEANSGKGID